jgi:hypothetical protein
VNEILVPDGFGPGSTFTVEFAEESSKAPSTVSVPPQSTYPTAPATVAAANSNNNGDDGFATGFHNPNFVPTTHTAPVASLGNYDNDIDLSAYPTASDAKPVYSSAPTYPASTY